MLYLREQIQLHSREPTEKSFGSLGWVVVRQQDSPRYPGPHGPDAPPSKGCPRPPGPQRSVRITSAHIPLARSQSRGCLAQGMLGAVVFILGGDVSGKNGELCYHRKKKDFGRLLDSALHSQRKMEMKTEINNSSKRGDKESISVGHRAEKNISFRYIDP